MNMLTMKILTKQMWLALSLLLAGSCFLPATAQRRAEPFYRQEISFGIGNMPFLSEFGESGIGEFPRLENRRVGYSGDLYDVYRTRFTQIRCIPVLSLDYRYSLARRVSLGADLSATRVWGQGYNLVSGTEAAKKEITAFYLIPRFRYDYLVSRNWRLFGHVGLGAGWWTGREDMEKISKVVFAGELVPIGVTFGRRFFGGAELVYGTVTFGVRASVGYRF